MEGQEGTVDSIAEAVDEQQAHRDRPPGPQPKPMPYQSLARNFDDPAEFRDCT